jgi:phage repressor protein C with HTH and peptisase S24 domain
MTKEKDPRPMGKFFARKVEKKFGYPDGWMDEMTVSASLTADDQAVEVPLLDVRGALGAGMELDPRTETVQRIWINVQWLRNEVRGTAGKDLAVITGKGDSMAPTITSDTPLLIDTSANTFDRDAIYVFTDGSQLFIKRIQRKIGAKGVTVLSDNPNYKPFDLTEDDLMSIKVLGRVIKKIVFETL